MILWRDATALAALALLPALALFLVWAHRRRQRALATFVEAALLPAVTPDLDPRRRVLRNVLVTAAALLVVVALAGPMWGFRWEEVRREGIDLVVAIDTSRSMLVTDVKPNRLARAKLAVQDLLGQLRGDRIALVAFAGTAFLQCPLTLDYGAFAQSLDAVEVGLIPKGGTALAAAIDTGLAALDSRQGKYQALLLITDGEDHDGNVKEAAKRAAERGVKVYTVGIGTAEGELVPDGGRFFKDRKGQVVKSRLDEESLQQIAVETGGVYLRGSGTSLGLAELYRDYIDTMEKRELGSTLERRFEQRYQVPLGIALALLLLEPLVGDRRLPAGSTRRWWTTRRRRAAGVVALALFSLAWLDPNEDARAGNRLYAEGKYEEAAERYNQALIDRPDSPLLHFNLGDAAYKQGKYDDALNAFQQVPADEADPGRGARAAYNVGNTKYRLGEAAEAADPQAALTLYAEALVAYRRAMGAAPDDEDARFNHEFVERKMTELRKKLEEQQQEKEQQKQNQQEQNQKQENQQQQNGPQEQTEQQQEKQQQNEQNEQPEQAEQQQADQQEEAAQDQQAAPEEKSESGEQAAEKGEQRDQQAAAPGQRGEQPQEGEMSPREAAALLDSQRDQEVRPDEMTRMLDGAAVAEPQMDW